MSLVLGAIGLAGGIAGTIIGSRQNRNNTNKTIAAQKQMQEYEWNQNLELYHYNNEYNTPAAQMQRLQDAGLNPNLVYGNGSVSGNTSGSLPRYEAPKPDYSGNRIESHHFLEAVDNYLNYQTKSAQIDNLEAQNELLYKQVERESLNNLRAEFDLGLETELRDSTLTKRYNEGLASTSMLGRAESESQIAGLRRALTSIELNIARETYPQAVELIQQELSNARKRGQNLDADFLIKVQQEISIKLENELRALGVQSGDHIAFRVVARILNQLFPDFNF